MTDLNARVRWDWLTAVDAAQLGVLERRVLVAFGTFLNVRTGRCFAGLDALARRTGVARSTAAVVVNRLVDAGWLDRRVGGGRGRLTEYIARIPSDVGHESRTVSAASTVRERQGTVRRQARAFSPNRPAAVPDHDVKGWKYKQEAPASSLSRSPATAPDPPPPLDSVAYIEWAARQRRKAASA